MSLLLGIARELVGAYGQVSTACEVGGENYPRPETRTMRHFN